MMRDRATGTLASSASRRVGATPSLRDASPSRSCARTAIGAAFGAVEEAVRTPRRVRSPPIRGCAIAPGSEASVVLGQRRARAPAQLHLSRQGCAHQRPVVPVPGPPGADPRGRRYLGDVVLAAETVRARSRRARHRAGPPPPAPRRARPAASARATIIETDAEAEEMERLETEILATHRRRRSLRRRACLTAGDIARSIHGHECQKRQTDERQRPMQPAGASPWSRRPSSRRVGSPPCAPGSACPARRRCARCWRMRSRAPATAAPSRPRSARCCCASCASAPCASSTSWCRAPTSSPSTRTSRSGSCCKTFDAAGVSRVPLFRETLDDPRGMVHVKDLMRWLIGEALGRPASEGHVQSAQGALRRRRPAGARRPRERPPRPSSAAPTCRSRSPPPGCAGR